MGAALLAPGLLALLACGASIQSMYESDVRFEHCMALDARPDVKPTIRRTCWEEWTEFYTSGQTRDRIDYALLREKQLSTASDFDEADWVAPTASKGGIAAPDPTSAVAPPPMLLAADGGVRDAGEGRALQGACAADCEQGLDLCRQACRTAPCEKSCAARFKRCSKRCD